MLPMDESLDATQSNLHPSISKTANTHQQHIAHLNSLHIGFHPRNGAFETQLHSIIRRIPKPAPAPANGAITRFRRQHHLDGKRASDTTEQCIPEAGQGYSHQMANKQYISIISFQPAHMAGYSNSCGERRQA